MENTSEKEEQTEKSERNKQQCLFQDWIHIQERELAELQEAIRLNEHDHDRTAAESAAESLKLVQKIMDNFQDYVDRRSRMARRDTSVYFSPPWFSTLENSLMWIGGCRPSSYIRLVYALCGLDIESRPTEFLQGIKIGNLGELSGQQVSLIDQLHRTTVREEKKLQDRMATLEEDILDQPLAAIARVWDRDCGSSTQAYEYLVKHGQEMASLLLDADQLRMNTAKELISILTPPQAVDFLASAKKLRLCLGEWGRKSDHDHCCS